MFFSTGTVLVSRLHVRFVGMCNAQQSHRTPTAGRIRAARLRGNSQASLSGSALGTETHHQFSGVLHQEDGGGFCPSSQ